MQALKGLYGALDPGSAAFHSFLETGRQELDQYPREPATYYHALRAVADEKFGRSPLVMLAFADGIFEIEITGVDLDTMYDWRYRPGSNPRDARVCINAKVFDRIKGAWLLDSCSHGKVDTGRSVRRCLAFSYEGSWETVEDVAGNGGNPSRIFYKDVHHPKPGDRYLVFMELHVGPADSTGSSAYAVNPMRDMQYEGGMFEIRDGKVLDSTNYFGLGKEPEIAALKEHLRKIIEEQLRP
jgi:hypothetical protein